jgi:crossover junction endodeoxyribonuclease RusA
MQKTIRLPWPPSVNHYLKKTSKSVRRSPKTVKYLNAVWYIVKKEKVESFGNSPLSVSIHAYPPDRKKRDLDNIAKVPLDALERAGVYLNDHQVEQLSLYKMNPKKGGEIIVTIRKVTLTEKEILESLGHNATIEHLAATLFVRLPLYCVLKAVEKLNDIGDKIEEKKQNSS